MTINNDLIDKLNSKDYKLASSHLKNVIKKNNLSDEDLLILLNLNNKLIINDFFNLQPKFSQSNLLITEKFINDNLVHKDKLFVSDLIEIAIDFNLNLDYKKCIGLLKKYRANNHYVLMSAMEYIFSNLKNNYISEIITNFSWIVDNKDVDTSARLKAAFYLFRITHKKEYLIKLKKIVANDNYNKDILKNLLKMPVNSSKYFEGNTELRSELLVSSKAQ